jgi:hypothetical protein
MRGTAKFTQYEWTLVEDFRIVVVYLWAIHAYVDIFGYDSSDSDLELEIKVFVDRVCS